MRRVLVTGAAGFIGTSIVGEFLRAGYRVRATDIPAAEMTPLARKGTETCPFDLLGSEDPVDLVKGADVVVHCAGLFDFSASREALSRANVDCVHRVAQAARRAGVPRMVALSSTAVYGRPAGTPCGEDSPKRPRNPYEQTKWLGEQTALACHEPKRLEVVALRPTLVYGPRSRYGQANLVSMMALFKRAEAPIYFVRGGGPVSSHVHVEDVARSALFAAETDGLGGEAYNVVGSPAVPVDLLGQSIFEALEITTVKGIPYQRSLWWMLVRLALALPDRSYQSANAKLKRGWMRLTEKSGLVPALCPRVEKNWIEYLGGAYVYDPGKLRSKGFRYRHSDYRESMVRTIRWYQENRWIP